MHDQIKEEDKKLFFIYFFFFLLVDFNELLKTRVCVWCCDSLQLQHANTVNQKSSAAHLEEL